MKRPGARQRGGLFFHGTRGDRSHIEAIRRDGLRALRHEWTHSQLGHEASTFLANAPVAGEGGDPVAFAMGYGRWKGPRSHGDGWIIVVLPRSPAPRRAPRRSTRR